MYLLRLIGRLFGIGSSKLRPDAPNERTELIPSDAPHRLRRTNAHVTRRDGNVIYVMFPNGERRPVEDARTGRYGRGT
ncbi:hypothetical protein EBS80_00535 [bacterium]|nr:hypothetical protein [bacterium]